MVARIFDLAGARHSLQFAHNLSEYDTLPTSHHMLASIDFRSLCV